MVSSYHMFFSSSFFGYFGQLAVRAALFLAYIGKRTYITVLGSNNFLVGQGMY